MPAAMASRRRPDAIAARARDALIGRDELPPQRKHGSPEEARYRRPHAAQRSDSLIGTEDNPSRRPRSLSPNAGYRRGHPSSDLALSRQFAHREHRDQMIRTLL